MSWFDRFKRLDTKTPKWLNFDGISDWLKQVENHFEEMNLKAVKEQIEQLKESPLTAPLRERLIIVEQMITSYLEKRDNLHVQR